ncbi:rhomboid family intramembrane serine protease [Croceibacter atlanticus]|jgi:membrane associated rhomboid family serine protease|uniref:rhomboid family intramembrane serine protease n=1 Tax=Croceibacter atlanticus TaxID=313588 RepID=UPI002E159AF1|nr:rhomboid family intramembrane serine protease [Croceibacter atlanticus]|tara:strand:- start:135673 stop:136323 length:651 start_codon:yes stop_codon:yes gene_type:complete
MGDIAIVTIIIIAANALVSYKGFNDFEFFESYKFNIGAIKRGEKVRMITSGFLHANVPHLIFNMITLYFFANVVIIRLGTFSFVIIYLVSLALGSLLSYYFHKDEYHYSAVGASGAVSGVIYASILLYPEMSLYFFFIPIPIPAYIFGIGYLLYSIYGMKKQVGNIGHDAHFGGAVGGYIMTLAFAPWVLSQNLLMVVLLALPIVVLYLLHRTGKI